MLCDSLFLYLWLGVFILLHLCFLGEACTIVLRGATQQILDEAERSLHDALCVLAQTVKDTRTVYGGGEYYILCTRDTFFNTFQVRYKTFVCLQ